MSTTFPRVRRSERGYDVEQVEDFLEEARRAYSAGPGELTIVTAASIRSTAFAVARGGYSTGHVDAALERLEDAFADRERESQISDRGDDQFYIETRGRAQEILDRLARDSGEKFSRASRFTRGYDVTEVDRCAARVTDYLVGGGTMTVDEVRTTAFGSRRGGYLEAQVDLLLDAVVDIMLAVR